MLDFGEVDLFSTELSGPFVLKRASISPQLSTDFFFFAVYHQTRHQGDTSGGSRGECCPPSGVRGAGPRVGFENACKPLRTSCFIIPNTFWDLLELLKKFEILDFLFYFFADFRSGRRPPDAGPRLNNIMAWAGNAPENQSFGQISV